ncbi:hypothetical protein E2C01_051557 [Portunus trituberculatus]|uniref:Uncharacterized protein n=1 Tax=Portunus trituberculatus TaxID=210409 RepID=A0A5B7GM33_PORTR|nr:hypothetical protein [Portunus trituberculatus]
MVVQWNHACFGVQGVSKCTGSNPAHGPSVGTPYTINLFTTMTRFHIHSAYYLSGAVPLKQVKRGSRGESGGLGLHQDIRCDGSGQDTSQELSCGRSKQLKKYEMFRYDDKSSICEEVKGKACSPLSLYMLDSTGKGRETAQGSRPIATLLVVRLYANIYE